MEMNANLACFESKILSSFAEHIVNIPVTCK